MKTSEPAFFFEKVSHGSPVVLRNIRTLQQLKAAAAEKQYSRIIKVTKKNQFNTSEKRNIDYKPI